MTIEEEFALAVERLAKAREGYRLALFEMNAADRAYYEVWNRRETQSPVKNER